jgi:hypothetical protein
MARRPYINLFNPAHLPDDSLQDVQR